MICNRQKLIDQIRSRSENLYRTHQLFCTEAVLLSLNEGLDGGLSEEQAVAVASGFPIGVGESGCMCGALSGGILALGLFMGQDGPYRNRKAVREASKDLHDRFKTRFRSTCCRVLTRKVRHDPIIHFGHCATLTGEGAEMTARILLEKRPELLAGSNQKFLARQDSRIMAFFINVAKFFW